MMVRTTSSVERRLAVLMLVICAGFMMRAGASAVTVLFDFYACGSGEVSDAGGSVLDVPGEGPVVYLKHGPVWSDDWSIQKMGAVMWNASLVFGTINHGDEFVVLCIGLYFHCDLNGTTAGFCDTVNNGNYSNFHPYPNASTILVTPTSISANTGDALAAMIPYCDATPTLWNCVAPTHRQQFTPSLQNVTYCTNDSTTTPPIPNTMSWMPCGGNGVCRADGGQNPTCECRGAWGGVTCHVCQACTPDASTAGTYPPASNGSCVAISGACMKATYSDEVVNVAAARLLFQQGVTIVFQSTRWFGSYLPPSSTSIRYNAGPLTTNASMWRNANFTSVPSEGSRRFPPDLNLTRYTSTSPEDGFPNWMVAVIPGNVVQFVSYNSNPVGDYIHCAVWGQLLAPSSGTEVSDGNRSFANWITCVEDSLNNENNFATVGGVVEVSQISYRLVHTVPPGCQYGVNTDGAVSLCSGHGVCSAASDFICQCDPEYGGVACEDCLCTARGAGAICNADGCGCDASRGFLQCSSSSRLDGGSFCTNVTDDVRNCGVCGNDCTHGLPPTVVLEAACSLGVCSTSLRPPLEWTLCFNDDDGSSSNNGTVGSDPSAPISCFRGYSFLLVFVLCVPLVVVSLVVLRELRNRCRQSHQHRQALFLLLALIGGLRMVYAFIALVVIATSKSPEEAVRSRSFFAATMITLNAYADLLTGYIDLLLTVYWMFVLGRVQAFPTRIIVMIAVGMGVTLTVATIVDYNTAKSTFQYTFYTLAILLFFTAMMHMSVIVEVLFKMFLWRRTQSSEMGTGASVDAPGSAAPTAHAITSARDSISLSPRVAAKAALSTSDQPSGQGAAPGEVAESPKVGHGARVAITTAAPMVSARRFRPVVVSSVPPTDAAQHQHDSDPLLHVINNLSMTSSGSAGGSTTHTNAAIMRSHFLRVTLIAIVCLLCWMVRSVMLLGRATKTPVFLSGALSFASPTFTTMYLTVLTVMPCLLIAVIFVALSYDVLRRAIGAETVAAVASTTQQSAAQYGSTNASAPLLGSTM